MLAHCTDHSSAQASPFTRSSGPATQWQGAPFTAMLLGDSDIEDIAVAGSEEPVVVLSATSRTVDRCGFQLLASGTPPG